jgi:diguanylate cyclase (GGDEF)-like protein
MHPADSLYTTDRQPLLAALSERLAGSGDQLTVLALVDLNNFSQINQRYGYATGDQILAELHRDLATIPKNPICCARIEGDKLAFIISPLLNIQLIPLVAKKINDRLRTSVKIDGNLISIEGCVGFSASSNPCSAETLLIEAEAAAKTAHALGVRYHLSEASNMHSVKQQITLRQQVAEALTNKTFELFYQPQIFLPDLKPRGAESLIRWPENRNIDPEQLIATVEQFGRMDELFSWTVNTALRESARWTHAQQPITTAVNLSASCLRLPELFNIIESSLNLWGADPSTLCIEVTESTIQQDLDQGFKSLSRIKELGIKISIDDFGTGCSSLEYFKYIPANELKIDKSFILNMRDSKVDMDIVKLILDWGRRFNLAIVAEGVEDQESLAILQRLGCDYAQGYGISKALPSNEFNNWLANYSALAAGDSGDFPIREADH